jgi:L-asparaginase / beta-aspartyl-peptidase
MWAVIIHGGAGALLESQIAADCQVLDRALSWAKHELEQGRRALDVAEGVIRLLEDSGNFVAGRSSSPNLAGAWELDASICDGPTQRAGAVAALSGVYPPISIARAVMERTKHVLLAGAGAAAFARGCGFTEITDPASFFVPSRDRRPATGGDAHGTVGAVVLDATGAIAAGTSTGGIAGKLPGRGGDSPIIGAGCWADENVGVSCTGAGEFFLRTAAAHAVSAYRRLAGMKLGAAIEAALADVAKIRGRGGIIAIDRSGGVKYTFNTEALRVACADSSGQYEVTVARRDPP